MFGKHIATVSLVTLSVGLDSTDSRESGGCTTYSAVRLMRKITRLVETELQFTIRWKLPILVRLNPNVPWKTRGNGAIAIHMEIVVTNEDESRSDQHRSRLVATIRRTVQTFFARDRSIMSESRPGWVLAHTEDVNSEPFFTNTYELALHTIVPWETLIPELDNSRAVVQYYGQNALVGAVAALGAVPKEYWSFELLTYRKSNDISRIVDENLICKLDEEYYPRLFNNCEQDGRSSRCIAVPKGPDAVVFGLRGYDPELMLSLVSRLRSSSVESYSLFVSNQHTGEHWDVAQKALIPYHVVRSKATVSGTPTILKGGHVLLPVLLAEQGIETELIAFKRSGAVVSLLRKLLKGDQIEFVGGVFPDPGDQSRLTIELEGLRAISLVPKQRRRYRECPNCNGLLTSAGRGKGVKCRKCSFKSDEPLFEIEVQPRLLPLSWQLPTGDNIRHLGPIAVAVPYPTRIEFAMRYLALNMFSG